MVTKVDSHLFIPKYKIKSTNISQNYKICDSQNRDVVIVNSVYKSWVRKSEFHGIDPPTSKSKKHVCFTLSTICLGSAFGIPLT